MEIFEAGADFVAVGRGARSPSPWPGSDKAQTSSAFNPDSLPATWTSTSKSYTEIFATQEYALYGSERLGIFHQTDSLRLIAFNSPGFDTDGTFLDKTSVDTLTQTAPSDSCGIAFSRGGKRYELSNHLGNVLAVISDRKLQVLDAGMSLGHYFRADIWSARDYYPFGMGMGGRSWQQNYQYRFGFQGQEQDQEFYGGAVSYKYRVHDPRIGRFLSIDPLAPDYPHNSPYAFSENRVIDAVELEGLEKFTIHLKKLDNVNGVKIDNDKADFIAWKVTISIVHPNRTQEIVNTSKPLIIFESKSMQEGKRAPNVLTEGKTYDLELKGFVSGSGYEFTDDNTIHIKSSGKGHSNKTYIHPIQTSGQGYLAGCKGVCAESEASIGKNGKDIFSEYEFDRNKKGDNYKRSRSFQRSLKFSKELVSLYQKALNNQKLQKTDNFELRVDSEANDGIDNSTLQEGEKIKIEKSKLWKQ